MTKIARFSRRKNDEGVTEVIGYVLSFALSAIFLLIALNVFTAARGNTEHVVTGVELKTLADQVAGRVVEMGLLSQEFKNATMNVTILIPQSLNGKLYTITGTPSLITAATDDGELAATSTTFKTDALSVRVTGSIGSSNEILRLHYDYLPDPVTGVHGPTITLLGE